MKVLVLNCGSSSLKYQLIDMDTEEVMAKGTYERIGEQSFVTHKVNGEKFRFDHPVKTHKEAIDFMTELLLDPKYNTIKSLAEIDGIGHRVAQGADKFSSSVIIDEDVIAKIDECAALAPVHNKAAITGIRAAMEAMPGKPNVAVFDTAFHQTMEPTAFMYGLPYECYEKYKVRRYGFHGTSHSFVSKRAIALAGLDPENSKVIVCHLGNGASVSAVKNGKSVDTSMGLTPLEGLVMGTRSGDIDPAIIEYLAHAMDKSLEEVMKILNKESGVYGLSGVSSDFRDLEEGMEAGNERATAAIEVFSYRVAKYIGAYTAAMNGVDAIAFTAGLGENDDITRKAICEYLGYLGTELDEVKNDVHGETAIISTDDSKVTLLCVPTNEELMIARDTVALVK